MTVLPGAMLVMTEGEVVVAEAPSDALDDSAVEAAEEDEEEEAW